MNYAFIFSILAIGLSGEALADQWDTTVLIPAKDGASAQTLNLETREIQFVLEGVEEKIPANCPANAYWALSAARIVNCADGTIYELRKTTKVGILGAFALIPTSNSFLEPLTELGAINSKDGPKTNPRHSVKEISSSLP